MKKSIISIIFVFATLTVFAQQAGSVQDQQACEYARRNKSSEIWQDYLKQFPQGMCAFEAKSEIKRLNEPARSNRFEGNNSLSPVERKIAMIKRDNPNRPVKQMREILKLRHEDEESVKQALLTIYAEILVKGTTTLQPLAEFNESPNRNISIPGNLSIIHVKSDYISTANVMMLMMKQNGNKEWILWDELEFNSEKKYAFPPGNYRFLLVVDRPDNKNVYIFEYDCYFKGGEMYVGEFKILGKYNTTLCPNGYIRDDRETCIAPSFKVFDNCDSGTHLVEHLCCEEGFNFIMEGQCSRYSDTVENVLCPAGYQEAGKGRCCPTGMIFINNKCQVPKSNVSAGGGQAVVMGSLNKSVVDETIRNKLSKIQWCYENGLAENPGIAGRVVVNFVISGTGKVRSSQVQKSTLGNYAVEECVRDTIKDIVFPAPQDGGDVIVNYPLIFKSGLGR